ncbi:MAG: flippase activity-associated protein Agl23 [Thermoanaerobaculaceae bacterium]
MAAEVAAGTGGTRFGSRLKERELGLWACLFILALGLRLLFLEARPPHHDEAIHGHFARELLHRHSFRYDPTYHGPLQYFVLAGLFALFGENDFVLRLYAAFSGAALTAAPALLRRVVGIRSALAMGLLVAISPNFLYFSRFARNDVPVVLFTALALAFLWRRRRNRAGGLLEAGVFLGLHAVSKETIYVYGVVWLVAGLGTAIWLGGRRSWRWLRNFCRREKKKLLVAFALFLGICLLFYTAFFSRPTDAFFFVKAVEYWYGQHLIQRVGGPWFFHFPRLGLYDFLILGLAASGFWRRHRRLGVVERFLLLWGLASLAMYAYLGEKVPWLSVHQLLPWIPLAGVELAFLLRVKSRRLSKVLVFSALAGTAWSALASSFLYPTIELSDPHGELLVFVQTTKEEKRLAEEGVALAGRKEGRVVAAVEGEAAWPLSWQWRDLPVIWTLPQAGAEPPLVVTDPGKWFPDALQGAAFSCETLALRAWWVERWTGVGPKEILRWFFTRKVWSPVGATEVQVCRKTGGKRGEL